MREGLAKKVNAFGLALLPLSNIALSQATLPPLKGGGDHEAIQARSDMLPREKDLILHNGVAITLGARILVSSDCADFKYSPDGRYLAALTIKTLSAPPETAYYDQRVVVNLYDSRRGRITASLQEFPSIGSDSGALINYVHDFRWISPGRFYVTTPCQRDTTQSQVHIMSIDERSGRVDAQVKELLPAETVVPAPSGSLLGMRTTGMGDKRTTVLRDLEGTRSWNLPWCPVFLGVTHENQLAFIERFKQENPASGMKEQRFLILDPQSGEINKTFIKPQTDIKKSGDFMLSPREDSKTGNHERAVFSLTLTQSESSGAIEITGGKKAEISPGATVPAFPMSKPFQGPSIALLNAEGDLTIRPFKFKDKKSLELVNSQRELNAQLKVEAKEKCLHIAQCLEEHLMNGGAWPKTQQEFDTLIGSKIGSRVLALRNRLPFVYTGDGSETGKIGLFKLPHNWQVEAVVGGAKESP